MYKATFHNVWYMYHLINDTIKKYRLYLLYKGIVYIINLYLNNDIYLV